MADKTVVEGSSVTASQLKELFRQIDERSLGHAEMQAFIEHRNPFFLGRNEHVHVVAGVLDVAMCAVVEISAARKPTEFFVERPGLWASESFKQIARTAGTLEVGNTVSLRHQQIVAKDGATDAQIESAFGVKHLFDETTVSAIIAEMISAQEGGRSGLLLNDGRASLFYMSGCVVNVYWGRAGGAWYVNTWERGDLRGSRDSRVFSPGS